MARLFFIVNLICILSSTADATSNSCSSATASSNSKGPSSSATSSSSSSSDSSSSSNESSNAPAICSMVCQANEEFSNCTQSICRELNCSQRGQPLDCVEVAEESCKSGCVCQSGYLKTDNGTCVPENQCYGDIVCKDTEVINLCPNYSFGDNCPTSEEEAQLSAKAVSNPCTEEPMCFCKFNYMRAVNGTCIPTVDCPPFECSGQNEEYNPCPPLCPSDDCSQASPTGRCPFGRIGIVLPCRPNCHCIPNYWRKDGVCVPYAQCPGKCPSNEEFSTCAQGVCRAQNCTQRGQPIPCPDIAEGSCEERCVCVEGTLRNPEGNCVPEDQCPVVCQANEEFSNCTQSICRELNCSQRGQPLDCAEVAKESCKSGCVCQSGYLKTDNGTCVPENQCYGDIVCKDTEVVNICPNYSFGDNCLTSEEEAQLSAKVVSGPCTEEPKCFCKFNYMRAVNGTCIPTVDCPPFECSGQNEEYNPCPPLCPTDDCSQASPTGRCPFGRIGIVLPCRPNCHCIPNYWRKDGVCVPYAQCPGKCSSNEEFSTCAQGVCRAQNCTQRGQPIPCPDIAEGSCEKRCVCVEGTLRNPEGNCVPEDQCPAPTCGQNEIFVECPNGCSPVNCPESYEEEQKTLADCVSAAVCGPAECKCLPDYRRDGNGKCIYIGECPGICPKNEVFSNCTQPGPSVAYPELANDSCEAGCVCEKGTLRDNNGNCVPKKQCKPPTCGKNEIFVDCPNGCSPVNCPVSYEEERKKLEDCVAPAVCGTAECKCLPDYRRDGNGKCIYIGKCPGICPKNEVFSNCTQALCPARNCTQSGKSIPCPKDAEGSCEAGCVCKKGTLRNKKGNCVPKRKCKGNIL